MNNISFLTSFTAGFLSFFSPCVFPLIIVYISLITGITVNDLKENKSLDKFYILIRILFFVLGFSLVFIALGVFSKYISFFLFKNRKILNIIIGFVLIFFSFNLLGILKFKFLDHEKRLKISFKQNSTLLWSMVLGIIFGAGWTPCVGPILGSILTLAAGQDSIKDSVFLLSLYSFGLAVPFLLIGVFYNIFLTKLVYINNYMLVIQKLIGLIILVLGILVINGKIF